jgi:hypothetical protein
MDLKVVEQVQKFVWNFEDIRKELKAHIAQYSKLVVNDDNVLEMENTKREIASLRVKISKFKVFVRRELEKPYQEFELQVKDLLALVESVEKPIEEQLYKYEVKRKEEKAKLVQQWINEISAELGLEEKYSSQIAIADKYLNRTQKSKDTKDDIQMKVCWFLDIQKKEQESERFRQEKIEMARFLVESLSAGLTTPLTFAEVEGKIESLDIVGLRTHIETEVSRRREREEKAAKQALERAEQERLAQEQARIKAEQEAIERAAREEVERAAAEQREQERIEREEQERIAEANRIEQERIKAEQEVAQEITAVEIPKPAPVPAKKYNSQFVVYGITENDHQAISDFLHNKGYEFKSATKEVKKAG